MKLHTDASCLLLIDLTFLPIMILPCTVYFSSQFKSCSSCFYFQVSSLKDTISRKDMEIEQLQLMKEKAKPPYLFTDKPNNLNSNQASLATLTLSYAEVNADAGHTSPTGIAPMRLDEADYEENAYEDGFSVRETEYSVGKTDMLNSDLGISDDMAMYVKLPSELLIVFFHYNTCPYDCFSSFENYAY